jgi:hypothetical protein
MVEIEVLDPSGLRQLATSSWAPVRPCAVPNDTDAPAGGVRGTGAFGGPRSNPASR